jgi:hypothetical protein
MFVQVQVLSDDDEIVKNRGILCVFYHDEEEGVWQCCPVALIGIWKLHAKNLF